MSNELTKGWWSLVLRGVLAIAVGMIALTRPGITLLVLLTLFVFYSLADGLAAIVAASRAIRLGDRFSLLLIEGIVDILAGLAALFWPALTLLTLILLIGFWALVRGFVEVLLAIRLRKVVRGEWLLVTGGILSILFGLFVVGAPVAGALVLAQWIAIYTLIFGVVLVVPGFRLHQWLHGSITR
jgi:uncharacterized membrane protein HdeD (DUF308 family)